jgi:hypothetical protein
MVDASHGEIVLEEDDFKAKKIQPCLAGNINEIQLNSKVVHVTQLVLVVTSIDRLVNETV